MNTVNGDAFAESESATGATTAHETGVDNSQEHGLPTPNGVVSSHHMKDANHQSKNKEGKKEHSSKDKHREHKEHKHKDHKHSKEHKSKENHVSSKEHSSSKHHHHHRDDKEPKDKTKEKIKDGSSKDKHLDPSKSKHSSEKKHSSDKEKHSSEKEKHSSEKEKHRSKDEKHKSEKHKSSKDLSSGDKPKDTLKLVIKPKDGSVHSPEKQHSSSKHSSSSSEKHKVKHSSSSEKHSQERSSSEKHRSSEKHHSSEKHSSDKPPSEKHSSSSEKHKVKTDKVKSEGGHKEKHKEDRHKEDRHKEDKHKVREEERVKISVKTELASVKTEPISVKTEPTNSLLKVKTEPQYEEDSPPQRQMVGMKSPSKMDRSVKKESEESDDEPLASRMEKVKKKKSDVTSSKKRKSDDEDFKPVKKTKTQKEKTKTKRPAANIEAAPSPKKKKKEEEEQDIWKWWEEEKKEDGVKWKTLQHSGPVFAPDYVPLPKNVKFYYDGKHFELSPEAEEVAGFYGRMLDHDYVTREAFNTNFFKDWRKVMNDQEKAHIKDLSKCNFREIDAYYKLKSEERKAMTKEEKQAIKKENEELQAKYGFCIIDGHKQKIGNFKIEPPGLFRGRGEHPKMGMLKRRVLAKDIIINIGKEADVPPPPPGQKWKEVRHDNTVTWLACWTENILGSNKYIMLNPSSKLKGEKDWQKYELARKLKGCAASIRQQYQDDWKSKEMRVRQRAVALYFIDKLALRAGNEKEEGETADTVGCCSLRVEHITLDDEKDGKECVVTFDFLGKDSIRYVNSVPVEKRVYKNLRLFMENKQPGDDLFDRLNTSILNKYLNDLMEGLTAKVFRTYNASKTLQEQLDKLTEADMSIPEKLLAYNRANRAVAILCNHQRSVPKTFDKQMENLQTKIQEKEQQIRDHKKEMKAVKESKDKSLYEKKKKRLNQLEEQLRKLEVQATDKEENKQIALGTSKLNYLDPRISVAWCKKWDVPIEKIYNKTQRDKFRWAIEMAGADYKF